MKSKPNRAPRRPHRYRLISADERSDAIWRGCQILLRLAENREEPPSMVPPSSTTSGVHQVENAIYESSEQREG